jgi:hypothetical protein
MAKFIKNVSGTFTEEATVGTSAGAGDTGKVVHLNASGVLDATLVNSKNTSAGVGDAGKLPALNASGVLDATLVNSKTTSAGAGDSGKLPALDAAGRLDSSFLPVGIGADTAAITTSEAVAAGDFVNVWNSTGAKARKADAAVAGKEAHGFVLVGVGSGAVATVYFEGTNTAVTGQTPGPVFLATVAGTATATAPSAAGNAVQRLGVATSATSINFEPQPAITLA